MSRRTAVNFYRLLVSASLLCLACEARAAEPDERRWGVGIELTALSLPRGHLGSAPNATEYAVTPMVVGRFQVLKAVAVAAGFGLPHPSMGLGGWVAGEINAPVLANAHKTLALSLFQQTGLQLGYAGPDYFARHGDDFVGYQYAVAGPLAFAFRLPTGVCLRWAGGYIDSYVQTVPIIALTPSSELFYDVSVGTRARF
ncbi:MAG: hypothetical protein WDO69_18560 [Pseudomonadota bacterium]